VRGWERQLSRVLITLLALFAMLYAGDWLVLRIRIGRGTAFGTVDVRQFLATSLKGNKIEYDFMGTVQQKCSHSIFPQQGSPACWWLERHNAQWQ